MKPLQKGLLLAVIHVLMVAALSGKLLLERNTLPRVWVKTAPYDYSRSIRERYVPLRVEVKPVGNVKERDMVTLAVEHGQLVARSTDRISSIMRVWQDSETTMMVGPLAYVIPPGIPDPFFFRPAGEELWVEVTVPKKGPPRPIRLGVKKNGGAITPLVTE